MACAASCHLPAHMTGPHGPVSTPAIASESASCPLPGPLGPVRPSTPCPRASPPSTPPSKASCVMKHFLEFRISNTPHARPFRPLRSARPPHLAADGAEETAHISNIWRYIMGSKAPAPGRGRRRGASARGRQGRRAPGTAGADPSRESSW